MKIETEFYQLEFPKYARKIKTKIIPASKGDEKHISNIFTQAQIDFEIQDEHNLGICEKYKAVSQKLNQFLKIHTNSEKNYHAIAKRLSLDMQLMAILG